MFCPNCGSNNSTEQKFCRSCGLNLEKTAESVLEQLPSAESAVSLRKEKLINRFGNFALGGLGVVVIIAVTILIYTIIQKFLVSGSNIYFAILIVAFIIFAFLSLIFVILNESLKEKKTKTNPVANSALNDYSAPVAALEDKPFAPIPSVVESSTELLPLETKTREL